MVSHSLDYLRSLSDRLLWIDEGKVRAFGEPAPIIADYRAAVLGQVLAAQA
jgi:lipopolysaccharide transport system ATP-binding protein